MIDVLKSPDGKMETSFPSSRFLRLGEKTSQIVETCGVAQKVATLLFDANGNLTNDGNGKVYGYDAANRLVSVTQGGTVTGYVYDGFGKRVQETLNGTVVKQWVWCGGTHPCEERDGSNNVTKRFYARGEQINGTNYYYTRDHLHSVREITDSSGNIVARYDYDPFGRRTLVSGTDLADFGFTGFYHDQATGLDFSKKRPYIAALGRWLNRDPLGEDGGINLYAYVDNNPISRVDPLGLWWAPPGYGKNGFAPPSTGKDLAIGAGIGLVPIAAVFAPEIAAGAGVAYNTVGTTSAAVLMNPEVQNLLFAGLVGEAGLGAADITGLGDPLDDLAQSVAENFLAEGEADYVQLANILHNTLSLIGDALDGMPSGCPPKRQPRYFGK